MTTIQRVGAVVNRLLVLPLLSAPLVGPAMGSRLAVVAYRGRRSGRAFQLVTGYVRDGETVTIGVELPDRKRWWRNFLGAGGPVALRLGGVDRTGHAVTERDDDGVRVRVRLDPA